MLDLYHRGKIRNRSHEYVWLSQYYYCLIEDSPALRRQNLLSKVSRLLQALLNNPRNDPNYLSTLFPPLVLSPFSFAVKKPLFEVIKNIFVQQ